MPEEKVVNMLRSDKAIKVSALNHLSTAFLKNIMNCMYAGRQEQSFIIGAWSAV